MKERRQRAGESLPELAQAIRRLANLAYPTANLEIRETLSRDQFVDALIDSDMRIRIKQSRPTNLNEAVKLAVELEVFNRAEHKSHLRTTVTETVNEVQSSNESDLAMMIKDLTSKKLQRDVDEIRQRKPSSLAASDDRRYHTKRKVTKCHYCHKPGHMRKDCYALKNRKSNAGKF
ncbi:uncharacterized protein [Magallana gigas]|uniref:uncharacterized protein n=1 Tax=Magallana gigas TaxID=29159 RepID=UPI003341D2E1